MSTIRDLAEFQSDRFAPVLPEECQVNPGRYGAELAFWLCQRLYEQGVVTSYPDYEDWGWLLSYATPEGDEFALHCGNIDGTINHWLVSLRRYGGKPLGLSKPSYDRARALTEALRVVLEAESSITGLVWKVEDKNAA